MRFRPYDDLTPTGKFLRKYGTMVIIILGSLLVFYNSYTRIMQKKKVYEELQYKHKVKFYRIATVYPNN